MNARFRCAAPAQSIATSPSTSASWRGPVSFPAPGEIYCGLRNRSIKGPPTSTAGPQERALRDRRDSRMDDVGIGRALDIRDGFAGAQTLTARNKE
jgi:hypothetical protein